MENDKLKLTSKFMTIGVVICFVMALVVGLVIIFFHPFESGLKYTLGLTLSTLYSFLRIFLMQRSVAKAVDRDSTSAAKNSYQLDFLTRQLLTIVFLAAAFLLKAYIGLIGVLVGMFFVKISGFIANALLSNYEKKHK